MPIENYGNIDDLDPLQPLVDDPVSEGDDHLRGIKESLQGNVQGDETFTALLADGFIQALVDALAFTVNGPPLIDLDGSAIAGIITMRVRNDAGGFSFLVQQNGNFQINETDIAGSFIGTVIAATKAGGVSLFENNVDVLQTVDRTLAAQGNSAAEVRDSGGTYHPVGFNLMPLVNIGGARTLLLRIVASVSVSTQQPEFSL